MSAKLASRRVGAKNSNSRLGNPIPPNGNPISPVMQKVKSLLPAQKAARELAFLIDEKLPHCQKLLCGERVENAAILKKLLRTWMGRDVLFVVMEEDAEGETPPWFTKYQKHLDANAARRQVQEALRAVEQLQNEAAE